MTLKLSLVNTVFLGSLIAGVIKGDAGGYNVENVWKSSKTDFTERPRPAWTDGVQKYHDDIIEAFGKFPPGPLMDKSNAVTTTFQSYITKLVTLSNSNSTVLSSGSQSILEVLKKVNLLENTPIGVINEFYRILPTLMETYRGIVSNVSPMLTSVTGPVITQAMSDLESSFKNYMTEFLRGDERGNKRKVDYEPVVKRLEFLNNTVSSLMELTQNPVEKGFDTLPLGGSHNRLARGLGILSGTKPIIPIVPTIRNSTSNIAENIINNPVTNFVQDAVTVVKLVLEHIVICFYGLSSCSEAVLSEQQGEVQTV
ncbi:uncharacterized protein LOC119084163 [Bradysia coprophila]|uniref:uncharacterized protein LOC119084163 n=1 Tax=Bradysia coprophila TaxID=38358 RepID=UPI00187DD121|nr:uncharacterized protein LOC119084163 [Bradysia coprophila]